MRREEVVELMRNLYEELGDLGLTPGIGNNYWPADDSYTLQVFATDLYLEHIERIQNFARKHDLKVHIHQSGYKMCVEFYDIKHRDGDW
ncbi:hypothetical protein [Thermococcus sp. 21S7]|uniref:hypothetical protein n=1 Tax=Thermococcus sp. 21S7 TaxID=1638221 RepID=UPI00143ABCC0|nr:hypothetical protein [Thermococcus sp. 21S7]NJE60452.1 hypothetical protein [Thermococcus sp. 21S7]